MLKAIETTPKRCPDCEALARELGDPDAKCEEHSHSELPEYRKTTLGELGANLPIGRVDGDRLVKMFSVKEFHYEREREIDKLRNKRGGAGEHPGKTTTTVLAHMLESWAGESVDGKQHKHVEQIVNDAYMEDVLYAWIFLRVSEIDPILSIETTCVRSNCQHEYTWKGDLRQLEVTVADAPVELLPMELSSPLTWLREEYDVLNLMPPKWAPMTMLKGSGTVADIKSELALSAVHSLSRTDDPEVQAAIGRRALDFMRKRDVERLIAFIDSSFPSVDSSFEMKCPECNHAYETPLDWTWNFFFGSSSMSADMTS